MLNGLRSVGHLFGFRTALAAVKLVVHSLSNKPGHAIGAHKGFNPPASFFAETDLGFLDVERRSPHAMLSNRPRKICQFRLRYRK